MSTLLHQAVQLAQAGQRIEARQMLWQFLQTEPDNEVAWLWLASVAADQTEYERALNEVLRINPGNPRAQQLLAEFHQQMGGMPPAAQYAPPPRQVTPQPPVSPYAPQTPPVSPPPVSGVSYAPQPPQPVEVHVVEKRRGCLGIRLPGCGLSGCGCLGCGGCGPGCMIALLVLVILPAVICGGLSLSPVSLGPFDFPTSFLPGEMGRKNIEFQAEGYAITVKTPRSWYLAEANDQMWGFWRDALGNTLPFEAADQEWKDQETHPGVAARIVDTNPVNLAEGHGLIKLEMSPGTTQGDFSCDAVRAKQAGVSYDYPAVYEYDKDLCGYREQDAIQAGGSTKTFKGIAAPKQVRTIKFYTPVDQDTAITWTISLPENLYSRFEDDIEALIESVSVEPS